MRTISTVVVATLGFSTLAFCQITDPVGFCPPSQIASTQCQTPNGPDNETIGVGTTVIGMEKVGNDTSSDPWQLILALPNYSGVAPTVTIAGFTQFGGTANPGEYMPTTSGDLYAFAGTPDNNGSLNTTNLFGSDESAAFGSTPGFFDVFVYSFDPAFGSKTAYTLNFGSALPAGTFLAGDGGEGMGFATTFTTAGLVNGPGCDGTNGCTAGPGGSPVPEPTSILLFGTVAFLALTVFRKKSSAA
jgi:hypothetical protein